MDSGYLLANVFTLQNGRPNECPNRIEIVWKSKTRKQSKIQKNWKENGSKLICIRNYYSYRDALSTSIFSDHWIFDIFSTVGRWIINIKRNKAANESIIKLIEWRKPRKAWLLDTFLRELKSISLDAITVVKKWANINENGKSGA